MFSFFRRSWTAANGERVVRKAVERKIGHAGVPARYEIWTAPSADSAKEYLNHRTITKQFYYLVVESPEGSWGKDCMGVYRSD
jgi:hypothetical protein